MDTGARIRQAAAEGTRTVLVAVFASAALAAIKIVAGLTGNSYALVADGLESVLDIFSSLVVLSAIRISIAPQTPRFPYGLGKAEPLSALAVATVLALAGVGIAVEAVREIRTPHGAPAAFTLFVLAAVIAVKEVTFRRLSARGAAIGSQAIRTDAWHHRSDALTSLAAFVGISIALVGGAGWEAADDWAALFACGVIEFNAARLLRTALHDVLDVAAPPDVERRVRTIAESVAGVESIEQCRVRRSGLTYLVDIHVEVDGTLSVRRGHQIAHLVKDALIKSEVPIMDVLVHIEPAANHEGHEERSTATPTKG